MERVINTKQYELLKDGTNFVYKYKEVDTSETAVIELENMMKTSFKSSHILKPKDLTFEDAVTATYKLSKEDIYMFDSLYEFEGNYITGGAETVLSHSHKMGIIKQLCEAIEELNKKELHIQKIDAFSLLYNYKLNHVSLDLVNVLSKEKEPNPYGFSHYKMYQEIKSEKKKSFFKSLKKDKSIVINKNNMFLGLLIHKILFNREWFNNLPLKEVQAKLNETPALSDVFHIRTEGDLVKPSFYLDFARVLKKETLTGDLTRTPEMYIDLIDNTACICGDGYLREEDSVLHCDACNSKKLGTLHFEEMGKVVPLIFSHQYNLSEIFNIKDEKILLRSASKDDIYALFIPSDKEVIVLDENGDVLENEMNSKGDHFKIDFNPKEAFERTIKINEDYTFTIKSLIPIGGQDETE